MKKRILLTLLFTFLAIPGFSQAKEESQKAHSIISMDEVIVTATRQEEKISSVPANVTVINETDIKDSTAYDIPDLLRSQVGVHVNDIAGNRRNYTVDLRGFGETASLNTLVLVDGRRVNQADLSGTDWTLIPLDRVKRIEIIRGGRGSVLYGDNAAGGVINIITKQGEDFEVGGELMGGSYDTFKGNAYASGSSKDLSYAISTSYLTSDGYRDNSDTDAKDVGGNLNYDVSDRMSLNFSAGYHKDDTGMPGAIRKSEFEQGASRTDTFHSDDYYDVEDYYFKGTPEIFFLNDSLFKMDLSFRKREQLYFSSFFGGTYEGDTEIETVTVSPQIVLKEKFFGFTHSLILGFDFEDAEENITNTVLGLFPSTDKQKLEKENYGYYIHDDIDLSNRLSISGGYRYDRAEFKFDPWTPDHATMDENLYTAGISYNFYKKSYAYFSFSHSFRYPVLDEFYDYITNTVQTDLKPQTSDDYEFGVRHYVTESLFASLNIFRIDTEDEIYFNPTTYTNQNLDGKTRRDGVEVSLTKTFDWATLSGTYTYTKATIESGQHEDKDFPNVPEHQFTFNTLFPLPYGFSVGVGGVYVGERPFISDFANAFDDQEDYFVLNTKIMYQWKKLNAFLNINNLTDEEYSEYGVLGSFPDERAYYPSPKINFLVGVSGHF